MDSVFHYSDYRKFIRDFIETKRALSSAFSYRYFAHKAGINSSSFYPLIIKGTRNLTKSTILKTCAALKLDDREAHYFENLVFMNQATTIREKNHFFEKCIELQKARDVRLIKTTEYDYFSQWYHCIIREVVTFYDFGNDYKKLAKYLSPPITPEQAEESVKLLLELGFLKKEDGAFVQTEPLISTGNNIRAHRIITFQITMLKMAIEAFDRFPESQRLNSSTTLCVSRETLPAIVKILRECRGQLMAISQKESNPEMVYQLNQSLFPMTNVNK